MTREQAKTIDMTPTMCRGENVYTDIQKTAKQILETPTIDWKKWNLADCSVRRNALETLVCIYGHSHIGYAVNARAKHLFDAIALDTIEQMEKVLVPPLKRFEVTISSSRIVEVDANCGCEAQDKVTKTLSDGESIVFVAQKP